ncbi:16S rRNA (guanine(527)-N(7))-methyltransferase RsmG [Deinococcus psychrotolerans]|uniref:Ribosomal RNA small subunit methyltransferase G n=1 Tax=Deinococcus psychrotolerans TaxID=2489213 RepID=A0A3G8YD25_9DEIO|nr:16S rRNA (guanine(527)-N(7))-methyltransferase RsmG [Deinococcus psychrotolerans]AZI42885.1 16S rRNA (guanine(527)-N(7))-methyltransferase RsmG [Deinococcus psychrotolerans]
MTPEGELLLLDAGAELQLDLKPYLLAFAQLQSALIEGNRQLNLTALTTERDIILKHFIDSLSCDVGGWLSGAGHVLDLGTGAGFPTLPLAIVNPAVQFLAVDATRKKIEYVSRTAASLGLSNVEVLASRAELLGRDSAHREQHQRVVARAVAALPVLAELALPLLQIGGLLVAQKGQLSAEELAAGQQAAAELGSELFHVKHFELPISRDQRSVVVMRKLSATPSRYPRREGIPSKQPLFWGHEQIKRSEDKEA